MKTRNAGVPKPSTAKKTPPARKSASKAQPSPSQLAVATPETVEKKRTSAARAAKQVKKNKTTPATDLNRRQSSAEDSAGTAKVTPGTKVGVATESIAKRTSGRARTPASVYISAQTLEFGDSVKAKVNASNEEKNVDIKDVEFTKEEPMAEYDGKPAEMGETTVGGQKPAVENVEVSATNEKGAIEEEVDPSEDEEDPIEIEESEVKEVARSSQNVPPCDEEDPVEIEESIVEEVAKSSENVPPCDEEDPVEIDESVIEEVAKSSENVSPCDEEDLVEIDESIIEEVAKSSENEAPCDVRQSVVDEVARSSENEPPCGEEDPLEIQESVVEEVAKSSENKLPCDVREAVQVKGDKESKDNESKDETYIEPANNVQNNKAGLRGEDTDRAKEVVYDIDEEMEDYGEKIDLGEHGEEELLGDDAEDHEEETVTLEDERKQLTAISKERRIKKEREVFLGGLDPDVVEEDVRRVFERIGGIVEVRLNKNPSTNKNKGYAFVEFKDKEHARRALSEMKNPVIRGKRCGTAPSEDNNTLFIGNICNTWTKEAIKQKLKDLEVEGVENINLVPDIQHEGLSRGFAFVEFSCHGDAMLAYKRLQHPDVIFGHPERTAKVAFAEPVRELDPEVMAQVKSIFVDGLPPHWDEKQVREQFKSYGEILRVVLARNMSTAKRKDFGFVDFSSHESAVACVNSINNTPLDDGNLKIKVKARLSNPLPKTQAVKGGIRGGFRIGRGASGVPRFGRDFGRGGHLLNRANFQRDKHFYNGGRGQTGRMGFPSEYDYDYPYADFSGRGGRRGSFRRGHFSSGGGSAVASPSSRPYVDRSWHGAPDRGRGMPAPFRRHPYSPEGHFDGPHMGGHFDGPHMGGHFNEPYFYDERDRTQGMKRPFDMRDYDPDYLEPSRHRPRLNYNDPTASFHGNHYSDTYGAGRSLYPHEYYGVESHYGPHSSYYGGNHLYGGGRYY